MTTPCNASHCYKGGVTCELDADHGGMHRHGEFDERVVYWTTPFDLSTRAELMTELVVIESLPSRSVRITKEARAELSERMLHIFETLYGLSAATAPAATKKRARRATTRSFNPMFNPSPIWGAGIRRR